MRVMINPRIPLEGWLILLLTAVAIAAVFFHEGVDDGLDKVTKTQKLAVYCKDRPMDAVCAIVKHTKP
jgi:hypothetical protein